MKNNASQLLLCSALSCALAGSAAAQPHARRGVPPPGQPPTLAGVFTNHSGKIRQLNYGPEGEINGFLASNGALVHLPPGADLQLEQSLRAGASVAYSGYAHNALSGRTIVDAQTLTINGQTVTLRPMSPAGPPSPVGPGAPPPSPPPAAAGVVPPPPNAPAAPSEPASEPSQPPPPPAPPIR